MNRKIKGKIAYRFAAKRKRDHFSEANGWRSHYEYITVDNRLIKAQTERPVLFPVLAFVLAATFASCAPSTDRFRAEGAMTTTEEGKVPNGFVLEPATLPGLISFPTFATFDHDGRLFVIESSGRTTSTEDVLKNPTFAIVLLEDSDDDGVFDKRSVFADKLPYPMGGTFDRGSFYATVPPDLIRFTDTDGDNIADAREVILTGWTLNHNAATLSGPFFGPDGWMYMCDARRGFNIKTKEGTLLTGKGARIWRCRPDGSGLEWISGGGFDNTIEMIFMPSGETIGTMTYFTDPQDGLRDALMHWVEGGVYPKPYSVIAEDKLQLTGELMPVMTKFARVSPAGLMRYRGTAFGEAFEGNLFSAQFNTGRIMRHIVTPDGATYRTVDEPFLELGNLELHPTDVLQDADGSLLVVNTGGWFIAGCPLSVTAKTDVQGSIMRIRRMDTPEIDDPRGNDINFATASVDTLRKYLKDPRPVVRDKAVEAMIAHGGESVNAFAEILKTSGSEEDQGMAVFALYRIGGDQALTAIAAALDDRGSVVRTAAARVLGLAEYSPAVPALVRRLFDSSLSVRRQAATALGQIGDQAAVEPLLQSASLGGDRFVEHAIVFALMQLNAPAPLVKALQHDDNKVRKVALIAIDQMEGSPIAKAHVIPFVNSRDSLLQQTGIWVLQHHREWSDVVVAFVKKRFSMQMQGAAEERTVKDLLVAFVGTPEVRGFISDALLNPTTPGSRKLLLLDVMAMASNGDIRKTSTSLWRKLLSSKHPEVQGRVLDLIQSHAIAGLDTDLNNIIWRVDAVPALRMNALRARLVSRPGLSDKEFNLVRGLTSEGEGAHIRRTAMALLGQATLTRSQLLMLAKNDVARAEVFLLPGLLDAFEGSGDEAVGMALVEALSATPDRLENISLEHLEKILKTFPSAVIASADPLRAALRERHAARLTALEEIQSKLDHGDVGEGRKLFFGKALCSTCHAVSNNGAKFGPDLTNIGEIRSQHDILEAILYPGASFAREYETSSVKTKQTTYTGVIKEQSPERIAIETGPGIIVRIPRHEVEAIESQNVSMMPPGLDKQLSSQELSDLMTYLTTLPDGMGHLRVAR